MSDKFITAMFPYPSGTGLHIGHWYNYAIVDSYCKIQRHLGHNVFQPFGYDAFGLPAENFARQVGGDPKTITYQNIANFREEMKRMNTSFQEMVITCDESYQKRTQWLFSELHKAGLAYKANRSQSYCPSCETVLAREQVKSGKCDRCGSVVESRDLNQWFFKITNYKDRLINDLCKVDYPEKTKKQQLHWLNKLEDWCVSRQRKWGCPIPIEGETDTLDTFVDSSFYTIEYDRTRPVDVYVGGNEHACMHLIYARFICKFLYDIGHVNFQEPFIEVIHQGMILGEDGFKMSKSKGNVIDSKNLDPQLLRMYLMFINHYFEGGKWQQAGYVGCSRFRDRFHRWTTAASSSGTPIDLDSFEETVVSLWRAWKTNRVVSEWMELYNKHKNTTLTTEQAAWLVKFFNTCF